MIAHILDIYTQVFGAGVRYDNLVRKRYFDGVIGPPGDVVADAIRGEHLESVSLLHNSALVCYACDT